MAGKKGQIPWNKGLKFPKGKCEVCGVSPNQKNIFHYKYKTFLCEKHRRQIMKFGRILNRTLFDKNEIVEKKEHFEIYLYNRKYEIVGNVKFDKPDLDIVVQHKWHLSKRGYAECLLPNKFHLKMHILFLGKKDNLEIDHINRDKLDNRRFNLRFVTHRENMLNSKRSKSLCIAQK